MSLWRGFGIYLLVGVVYQVFGYFSLNVFNKMLWVHILFWLPLIIIHWLFLLIIVGLILWAVSVWVYPDLGKFFVYCWQKAKAAIGV